MCNEDSVSLQNEGYMLQEKKRLGEEWKSLEEQRKSFERERRNFTEAAIRLSHEVNKILYRKREPENDYIDCF